MTSWWPLEALRKLQAHRLRNVAPTSYPDEACAHLHRRMSERLVRDIGPVEGVPLLADDVEVTQVATDQTSHLVVYEARWQPHSSTLLVHGGPADGQLYESPWPRPARHLALVVPGCALFLPDAVVPDQPDDQPALNARSVDLPLAGWHPTKRAWVYAWPKGEG